MLDNNDQPFLCLDRGLSVDFHVRYSTLTTDIAQEACTATMLG